jgi:hypothetical protein
MKETININTTVPSSHNWYMAEAVKSACVSNGFDVVSDTTPTFVSEPRTIILSKTGVPYNLVLYASPGPSSVIFVGLGIGQQVFTTNSMSINLRNNSSDLILSGQIHLAYNTNFLLLGCTHYNEVPSYPTYTASAYIPSLLADMEYPYMVDTSSTGRQLKMYKSDGTTITGISGTTIFNSDSAKFIRPDGKIMLIPLYFNFSGVAGKTVQATLTDAYVSLCEFPPDCPNEFTLDGDNYVRRGVLVFKI